MIRVLVVTVRSCGGGAESVIANYIAMTFRRLSGLRIERFDKDIFDARVSSPNKLLGYIKFLLALRKAGRGYHFVVSGVEGIPALLCSLAFFGLNRPRLVLWLHCCPSAYLKFQTFKNRLAIRAGLFVHRNILCAAPVEVDALRARGKNAIFLPNILNEALPTVARNPGRIIHNLVFVGSLAVLKQPKKALEILLGLLENSLVDLTLGVFGTGPLRQELEYEIGRRQLGDRVIMHGFVSDPWQIIAPGSILLLPSLTEAMPMVVIEALNHGCAVISNTYKGHDYFIGHRGLFWSVDYSNVAQVVSVVQDVLGLDSAEYLSRRTRSKAFVDAHFDADNSLGILRSFLKQIDPSLFQEGSEMTCG